MIIRDLLEQRPALVLVRQPQQSILAGTDADLGVDVLLPGEREVAGEHLVRDTGHEAPRRAVLHLAVVQRRPRLGGGVPGPQQRVHLRQGVLVPELGRPPLPETEGKPSARGFAECNQSGTRQTSSLPSAAKKHSAK